MKTATKKQGDFTFKTLDIRANTYYDTKELKTGTMNRIQKDLGL